MASVRLASSGVSAPGEARTALCVLGCRSGSAALARRAHAAWEAFLAHAPTVVVLCGGRSWDGHVEADELARMLAVGGVPEDLLVRERTSVDTRTNALEAARILAARDVQDVVLVTCSWHLPRASHLFRQAGLRVVGTVGAPPPDPSLFSRAWWYARERVSGWKDALSWHRA